MTAQPPSPAGLFLVFDGPDGSGKTTQFNRYAEWCRSRGVDVEQVREPGGTSIGEQIRSMLLDCGNVEMTVPCELFLYMASRSQLVRDVINPAIERGALVLADRFISSTLAYQGTAGGVSQEDILATGEIALGGRWPDCVVIFDVDGETAAARRSDAPDRMEGKGEAFHQRVRQGYLDQVAASPEKTILVDASGDEDEVFALLVSALDAWMVEHPREPAG
ncbi:MAG: dTMP kinase [Phycisphaerae bacterium]|nr:dTMP kinase [Phycisphaerae bacterium]